jgi:hypothetical protein
MTSEERKCGYADGYAERQDRIRVMIQDDIVLHVIEVADKLEFLGVKSKAKDRVQQERRLLKQLRKFLNDARLDELASWVER